MLHNPINKTIYHSRHSGAPLRSKVDSLEVDGFPIRLLYIILINFDRLQLFIIRKSCQVLPGGGTILLSPRHENHKRL